MTDRTDKRLTKAVAIKYDPGESGAPRVLAKGQGKAAERIIEIARRHGVHVHSDPDLAEILYRLDLLEEIPPHLYLAVAKILAFVYDLNEGLKVSKDREDWEG